MPQGHRPHGLRVDKHGHGMVWTTGNSTIGKPDPASGRIVEFKTPSGRGGRHTPVITIEQSTAWFTLQSGDTVASRDSQTATVREYESSSGPYGLSIDKAGHIGFCLMGDNKTGMLDPRTGQMSEVGSGRGSRPRRLATTSYWHVAGGL